MIMNEKGPVKAMGNKSKSTEFMSHYSHHIGHNQENTALSTSLINGAFSATTTTTTATNTIFSSTSTTSSGVTSSSTSVTSSSSSSTSTSSNSKKHSCLWANCTETFEHVLYLGKHILDKHINNIPANDPSSTQCLWQGCGRLTQPFSTKMKLIMHVRSHTGEKPYACSIPGCGKTFGRMDILNKHLKSHANSKVFVCTIQGCGSIFASEDLLQKHIEVHPTSKPYVCSFPGCTKRYSDSSSLYKHTELHRQSSKPSSSSTSTSIISASTSASTSNSLNGIIHPSTSSGSPYISPVSSPLQSRSPSPVNSPSQLKPEALGFSKQTQFLPSFTASGSSSAPASTTTSPYKGPPPLQQQQQMDASRLKKKANKKKFVIKDASQSQGQQNSQSVGSPSHLILPPEGNLFSNTGLPLPSQISVLDVKTLKTTSTSTTDQHMPENQTTKPTPQNNPHLLIKVNHLLNLPFFTTAILFL